MDGGTWLPADSAPADPGALLALCPALDSGLRTLRESLEREGALPAGLVARMETRVAWLLTAAGAEPVPASALEAAAFAYADAFVQNPHAVADAHVTALERHLTVPQVVALTELLALLDGFTRFRLILAAEQP
ncbi:MAG TPA: hypothetical protein VNO26_10665 [Candidatus Limnocylindria bacterium]|nr:hypothetical protein [Candidatus Limnocylindria bacterium]